MCDFLKIQIINVEIVIALHLLVQCISNFYMHWSESDLVPNQYTDISVNGQGQGHAFSDYRILAISLSVKNMITTN